MKAKPLMILCIFHKEKTPSLRVLPNGQFRCYGCGEIGDVKDHPELRQAIDRHEVARLEAAGQLRFPGF